MFSHIERNKFILYLDKKMLIARKLKKMLIARKLKKMGTKTLITYFT